MAIVSVELDNGEVVCMTTDVLAYLIRRRSRMQARMDAEEGQWVTTEDGNKVHINSEGVADKGNPYVVAAANGYGKLKKTGTEWGKSLSKDERKAVRNITGGTWKSTSAAEKMNDDLRKWGYATTEAGKKIYKDAKAAIDKFEIKEPMTVVRWANSTLLGGRSLSLDEMKKRVGITVGDHAFMSSAIQDGSAGFEHYPVMYEINVPAGKGIGAYVEDVSKNPDEREFLFNAASTFKVEKVEEIDHVFTNHPDSKPQKKVKVTLTWQPEKLGELDSGDMYKFFIDKQLKEKSNHDSRMDADPDSWITLENGEHVPLDANGQAMGGAGGWAEGKDFSSAKSHMAKTAGKTRSFSKSDLSKEMQPVGDGYDFSLEDDEDEFIRKNTGNRRNPKPLYELYKKVEAEGGDGIEAVQGEYYKTRLAACTENLHEIDTEKANEILDNNVGQHLADAWFREYNHEVKDRLIYALTQNPEVHNAALNVM